MSETVFEIVAEHPQKQHIAEDMHYTAVHKHRGKKSDINRNRSRFERDFTDVAERIFDDLRPVKVNARRDFLRHERKCISKIVVRADALQNDENQNVYADDRVINVRRDYPVAVVVADGKHFCKTPFLKQNLVNR